MTDKFTVGLIVNNHFGVLNRVAGLFAKRGYNIDSLAVGVTENPEFSRMTIVSTGDEYVREQVIRQLQKLHDVKVISLLEKEKSVSAEHILIKIKADSGSQAKISQLINEYGGKTMDFGGDFITAEVTASTDKINEFVEKCKDFGIFEVCRSGAISLSHGVEDILNVSNQLSKAY